jgi:membrane associated rhomboid family serine protease
VKALAGSESGASGAISGVLGGYILLHPKRRVTVILFRFLTDVPAYVAIGIWFAFQLISGLGMLGGGSQQVALRTRRTSAASSRD